MDVTPTPAEIPFVAPGFEPPPGLTAPAFALEPLGPQHNESDYAAWTSSLEHIRATPGFEDGSWPHEMTPSENLGDLEMHARDFATRRGFTYTVLDPAGGDVIGCVYIYPVRAQPAAGPFGREEGAAASVRSWTRADRAHLDVPLWEAVSTWLAEEWPFTRWDYAARE